MKLTAEEALGVFLAGLAAGVLLSLIERWFPGAGITRL